jgi:hypothetical protein
MRDACAVADVYFVEATILEGFRSHDLLTGMMVMVVDQRRIARRACLASL